MQFELEDSSLGVEPLIAHYTLSGRVGKVVASHAEGCKIQSRLGLSCTDLYYARGAQGVQPMRVGGATN